MVLAIQDRRSEAADQISSIITSACWIMLVWIGLSLLLLVSFVFFFFVDVVVGGLFLVCLVFFIVNFAIGVVVVFGLYFLVSSSVITTGAVDCGGVCVGAVIFGGVIGLYCLAGLVLAVLSVTTDDSELSVIVLCVLLSSFGLCSCAAVVGVTPVGATPIVVFQISWNTTNALYEFFVVFLFLVLVRGLVLDSTGRRFCLVCVIVVLFVSLVLDVAVVVGASCIKVHFHAAAATAGATVSSLIVFRFA